MKQEELIKRKFNYKLYSWLGFALTILITIISATILIIQKNNLSLLIIGIGGIIGLIIFLLAMSASCIETKSYNIKKNNIIIYSSFITKAIYLNNICLVKKHKLFLKTQYFQFKIEDKNVDIFISFLNEINLKYNDSLITPIK